MELGRMNGGINVSIGHKNMDQMEGWDVNVMIWGHSKLSSHSRVAVPLWIIVKSRAIELYAGECKSFQYKIEQNWEKSECFELMTVCWKTLLKLKDYSNHRSSFKIIGSFHSVSPHISTIMIAAWTRTLLYIYCPSLSFPVIFSRPIADHTKWP